MLFMVGGSIMRAVELTIKSYEKSRLARTYLKNRLR